VTQLIVQLLGPLRVLDAQGAEIKIPSRKSRALLAYLAAHPAESHTRERLAALLWEEADEELARTSLRQAIATLRKSLPPCHRDAFVATNDSIALDDAGLDCDLARFRSALACATKSALHDAANLYRGELLDGFDARSSAFEEWLTSERLRVRREAARVLQALIELCVANQDADTATHACAKLLALEPLNEAAHRRMMELHAQRGAYTEALRQYRLCREALRRELDVAPEPATDQLYRALLRRRRAACDGFDEAPTLNHGHAPEEPAATPRPDHLPQLRDAVVLVARMEGLLEQEAMLDPEDAHTLASAFQDRVHRIVKEFGGNADRRVGSNVLAVFGLPTAHGNEAERGARAALMLRDSIVHDPLPASGSLSLGIGLAIGQVLPTPALFPLSGRPTHVAHTLASRASPGEVLISEELRQSLGERVRCQPAAESDAWSLESIRSHSDGALPFVGRRPELAMVLAALDRCRSSRRGRAFIVRGEAGIGKTRLVDAVIGAARERGVEVHTTHVFDFGQSPGRGPIPTLALSLMDADAEANALERTVAVRRLIASRGAQLEQTIFFSDLVDAPLEPELAALEAAMDTTTRQRGRTLALAQLIEWSAERAAQLFIVEDIHWASSDELTRLAEIAAIVATSPILLIMTTRPEGDPIGATWRARARGCPVTTLDLAPLAQDEAEELAAFYPELPHETIAACIERAEGYPLFLDQLLRAATSGGNSLPGSVRTLILARADRLPTDQHRALQAGAVLGQQFALDALRALIDADDYEPSVLVECGFVRSEGAVVQFAHALFRDAVYESILKSHRRELHRRAAEWFAARDLPLHADHLAAAHDPGAADAYATAARAEQQALRFERALNLAQRAATLARDPNQLHATHALLGELLLQLGRTHDALTAFRESLDFAQDAPSRGRAWLGIASALRIMDRHEEALESLDQAEAQWHDMADARLRAQIYTLRGNLLFPLGQFAACRAAHEQAYRYASEAKSPLEITRALGGLGDAHYQRGHMIAAQRQFAQCVREARAHNLAGVLLANLPMLAISEIYYGSPSAGREHLDEALELAKRIGDLRSELLICVCYCEGHLIQARYQAAHDRALHALELAKQLGARRFQAECTGVLAAALYHQDHRQEALKFARDSLVLGREVGMSYCGPVLLSLVARTTNDPAERAKALREGESLLDAGCVSHSYFNFYMHSIDVVLDQGAWHEARRYAAALQAYTAQEPLPFTTLLIERAHALADLGEGMDLPETHTRLRALKNECLRLNALSAMEAIDAAIERSGAA
jgi:DNA-binding SARP family transcriptional activator/predicted negative regulator of RcsB-dependent stress response